MKNVSMVDNFLNYNWPNMENIAFLFIIQYAYFSLIFMIHLNLFALKSLLTCVHLNMHIIDTAVSSVLLNFTSIEQPKCK